LSGRTDLQKAFLMIGPTRSGKGTIARVLKELIGSGATAGPTLPSLATNFGLQTLIGKPLAIVSDARLTQQSATQAVERLLQITGEDMVTADRKFMDPRNGQLPTRFMILSNELPKFYDAGGAIAKRMVITQMTESFLGREDPRLTRSLLAELPGILNWALDGLDHLVKAGSFTEPDSSYAARQILEDSVSPVAAFVRDYCEVGTDKSATKDAIFTEWKMWCEKTNHLAGSPANFARNLLAAVPTARPARPRDGGQRVHTFEGIELKPFHKRDT
jgi:putative DNA primase/helicase